MLQRFFICFLLLNAVSANEDLSEIDATSMATATVLIINTIYSTISQPLYIMRAAANQSRHLQSDLIDEMLISNQTSVTFYIEDYRVMSSEGLRYCNLLLVDSYEAFE